MGCFFTAVSYTHLDVYKRQRMGRSTATDQEVEDVAKAAGCDEFIRKLENGYDTVVGSAGGDVYKRQIRRYVRPLF